jgi:hypothetical protein
MLSEERSIEKGKKRVENFFGNLLTSASVPK